MAFAERTRSRAAWNLRDLCPPPVRSERRRIEIHTGGFLSCSGANGRPGAAAERRKCFVIARDDTEIAPLKRKSQFPSSKSQTIAKTSKVRSDRRPFLDLWGPGCSLGFGTWPFRISVTEGLRRAAANI